MDQFTQAAISDPATARDVPRAGTAMSWLSSAAVLLAAVPLLAAQPAPLEDWPSHLARAEILTSLLRGERFWSQYYHVNSFLPPNVVLDIVLTTLHSIGLSIATGGTIFLLATYSVFIAGGIRLAQAFGASDPVKPPIIAMLFFNGALIGGFANYMMGLGLALCVFAAWIEASDRPLRRLTIAAAGAMAVFFAHLIAAAFLVTAIGLFELHALMRQRLFTIAALLRHASFVAAAAAVVILFGLSPTTADGPGGGGPVSYTGAPSLAGIAKGKLILLFHPLLDGSGIIGASIMMGGMGLFLLLVFLFAHPRLLAAGWFIAAGLALLVVVLPDRIGAGFGLDYRLVVPLASIVVCATTLKWQDSRTRWGIFVILLTASATRSGAFIADFRQDSTTYRAFEAATAQIPPDSVLLTGMGSRWDTIPWGRFWAPPAEYLATQAAPSRVFVPTVFAVLWSNRHRSFNSARGNKTFWPNGHLKRDATTNTLISFVYSGIWWRLLHNTASSLSPANIHWY